LDPDGTTVAPGLRADPSLRSRINTINESGVCIIGMEKKAMMPLIIFDVMVNVGAGHAVSEPWLMLLGLPDGAVCPAGQKYVVSRFRVRRG
jgi:hypothetical protein